MGREEVGEEPIFRRIFTNGRGRSIARALAFFAWGYITFTALAVLWLLGGIARGMGGGGPREPSLVWWFLAYSGVTIALISQLWYLLLKPVFEDAETSKKRVLALVPILATAGLLSLDYLVWGMVVLGIVPETASSPFIGGRMIPHGPEDTIGESFVRVGFVYLLLLLAAFVLTVASRRGAG